MNTKTKIQGKDRFITKTDFNQKENCIFRTRTFLTNVHLGKLTNVIFLGQNNVVVVFFFAFYILYFMNFMNFS